MVAVAVIVVVDAQEQRMPHLQNDIARIRDSHIQHPLLGVRGNRVHTAAQ